MMKSILACMLLLCSAALVAAHPLEGKWLGGIDTDRGQMQIGLQMKDDKGTLTGTLQTAHGDWPVTTVTQDNDTITVTFDTGEGLGHLKGRVDGAKFSGDWDSPMASGTFELTRQ